MSRTLKRCRERSHSKDSSEASAGTRAANLGRFSIWEVFAAPDLVDATAQPVLWRDFGERPLRDWHWSKTSEEENGSQRQHGKASLDDDAGSAGVGDSGRPEPAFLDTSSERFSPRSHRAKLRRDFGESRLRHWHQKRTTRNRRGYNDEPERKDGKASLDRHGAGPNPGHCRGPEPVLLAPTDTLAPSRRFALRRNPARFWREATETLTPERNPQPRRL